MPTSKTAKVKNPHRGSSFDSFLEEEGILEEVEAVAVKRAIALKIADLMQKGGVSKVALARRMSTSRAQLDRLLDPENPSVTLGTLSRAAKALGRRVTLEMVKM
jgi:DNA-binding Xre family transcriptional regulator